MHSGPGVTMISRRTTLWLCMALLLATAVGCDEAGERLTAAAAADGSSLRGQAQLSVSATVLHVADVEQLYAAVNDAANEGAAITLAPGTYVLSATNAAGVARPNAGRLELQRDMSLYGVTGERSAVVIDASDLPTSSFNVSFGRTAPVRIGRGSNAIEWLTVLGNPEAAAGIATELPGTPSTRIRVAHVVSGGSSRGVDVRNVGAASGAGRRIDAEIVDNEFFGPSRVVGLTEGIRLVNFVGANGAAIVATLSGNRTHGFQLGCIVANNRSSNAVVEVRSSGDRFFANELGCQIAGGLSQALTGVANSSSTIFEARGSQFTDNTAAFGGLGSGGIRVDGGLSVTQANVTSSNRVRVALWGSKVADNLGVNFEAFGARQEARSGLAGTNNHVTIELHGVSKQIDVQATGSVPADPAGSNTVSVIR